MPFEVSPSQKDQTLPMILTLRGDEGVAADFAFDSDQAMTFLGIKRSRLNQISGRELRVARIRRDRYIRPVYRECDLKDYLEWTRATASHLSSSKAIEHAVENLDDRFNDVLQVFNERLQQVTHDQQSWMKGEFESLPGRLLPSSREARAGAVREEKLPPPEGLGLHREDKILRQQTDRLKALQDKVGGLDIRLGLLAGLLDQFVPLMNELNIAQKSLRLDFDQHFEALREALETHHEGNREQRMKIASGQSQDLAALEALLKEGFAGIDAKGILERGEETRDREGSTAVPRPSRGLRRRTRTYRSYGFSR